MSSSGSLREQFVSSSGTTVTVHPLGEGPVHGRDAVRSDLEVITAFSSGGPVEVLFLLPPLVAGLLKQEVGVEFDEKTRRTVATMAVLDEIDQNPEFLTGEGRQTIEVNAERALGYYRRPKLPDRRLRRYLARRVYDHYSRSTLDSTVAFDQIDLLVTGAGPKDFLRSIQVLAEEGYLKVLSQGGEIPYVQGTAKLVREVENYGAAREDAVTERDYAAALAAYPLADEHRDALLLERKRYEVARTPGELASVFRAAAPILETILRELLRGHGWTKGLESLGPMIGELHRRNLGDRGLLAQLNHVLKFGRDLAEHGHEVPEPVLRIACENAFELVPQLGSLWPKGD